MADVRARGDEAVRELTERFDGAAPTSVRVDRAEMEAALERVDPAVRTALLVAAESIRRHHEGQMRPLRHTEDDGLVVRSVSRPVGRAGGSGGAPGVTAAPIRNLATVFFPRPCPGVAPSHIDSAPTCTGS